MANGRGKIHGRMNARYPEIVPEGVADFLTRSLDARAGGWRGGLSRTALLPAQPPLNRSAPIRRWARLGTGYDPG